MPKRVSGLLLKIQSVSEHWGPAMGGHSWAAEGRIRSLRGETCDWYGDSRPCGVPQELACGGGSPWRVLPRKLAGPGKSLAGCCPSRLEVGKTIKSIVGDPGELRSFQEYSSPSEKNP